MNISSMKSRRQRAILSCNDCRRRKLKCDRLKPCNRCIQGGVADSCAYGTNAHLRTSDDAKEQPSKRPRMDPARTSEIFETKSDICHTQSYVHSHTKLAQPANQSEPKDTVEFLAQSPNLKAVDSHGAVMGLLKGRGYATFFYGSSSAISIIALFPELRKFMKEIYSNSTARRLSQDMKRFEDQARSIQPLHRVLRITTLRSLLPDRSTVDILVHKYLETFENTLRILHIPTFQKHYAAYWDGNHETDTDMDAIILMILSCTICTATHDSPRYNHNGSSFHTRAAVWIRACEVWLKRQSNKHKSLANFQVRCLRLLALATTGFKIKEYYHEVQTHLAVMRSHGMHRDPSIYGNRCSTFEGEIRRRLWATSMELELQASVDKGIPSMLSNIDYDCAPPRNINDVDLTIELEVLPPCQDDSIFTDTSFLHCSLQHLDLRVRLCSLANDIRRTPDNEALLEVEAAIRQRLNSLPQWSEAKSFSVQVLLKLHLQQYIIVLFASKALRMETGIEPGSRYFAVAALEAAESTIDLHSSVLERSNYALCLTRIDYFRAALFICRLTYSVFERQDKILTRFTKLAFEATMSKAMQIQEERAMRPGRGTEYLWYLSAATSLVGLTIEPSQADKMKRQAIDRMAKLLYKQLSLQDEPSAESLASEILLGSTPNAGMNLDTATATTILEPSTALSFDQAGLSVNDFGLGDSSSNWSFDDYWFFNDVLGLDFNTDLQPALY